MGFKLKLLLFIWAISFSILNCQTAHRVFQTGHSSTIENISFNYDGKYLASTDADNSIIIWEFESGKQFGILSGHKAKVNAILFNPLNPNELISCSDDSTIIVWDYKKVGQINQIKAPSKLGVICYSEFDKSFYIGGNGLYKVDFIKNQLITKLTNSIINAFASDESGFLILSCGEEHKIKLFNTKNDSLINTKTLEINKIIYSKSNHCFYGINYKTSVSEISHNTKSLKTSSYLEQGKKFGFNALIDTKNELYCAGGEQNIYIYNKKNFSSYFYYGHTKYISALAINIDETIIASASADNTIILWDKSSHKPIRILKGNYEEINSLKFSKNKDALLIAYKNTDLKYWELNTNEFHKTSISLNESKKRLGWKNSVIAIDSVTSEKTYICYIEYLLNNNSNIIKKAIFYKGVWNYSKNSLDIFQTSKMKYSKNNLSTVSTLIKDYRTNKNNQYKYATNVPNFSIESQDSITAYDFNSLYNFYAVAYKNGNISFYNTQKNNEFISNIGLFNSKDFLFSDNVNNYYGTKEAINFMNIRYNSKLYNVSQLDVIYNRPDIILQKFPYINQEEVAFIEKAVENRRKKSKIASDATAEDILKQLPEIQVNYNFNKETNLCTIKTILLSKNTPIRKTQTKINGVPVSIQETDNDSTEPITIVELANGPNYIEVTGIDQNDLQSLPSSFSIINDGQKKTNPNLYLIGISASEYKDSVYNLNYAAKDVNDIVKELKRSKNFNDVNIKTFQNKLTLTSSIIEETTSFLKNVKPNDVVIIFYAGHGVLDENYNYYLGTYDMDFNSPKNKGLSYSDLIEILDNTKSRNKLCLIDACHSGEIDKDEVKTDIVAVNNTESNLKFRAVGKSISLKNSNTASAFELSKQLFTDLKQTNGTIVISASGGLEYAIESNNLKNGVFTYALLESINQKKADYNADGKITVKEIETYLPLRVSELTNGKQKANSRTENNLLNFDIR